MLKKRNIIIFVVLFLSTKSIALETDFSPSNQFTISNGLPHNGVTCIFEDSRKYLWIGTYDGIARYDGYSFKVFKNLETDIVLSSNRVRTITEDNNKNLVIGTDDGITVFDYPLQSFKTIYSNKLQNKGIKGPVLIKIINNEVNGTLTCLTEDGKIIFINKKYELKDVINLKKIISNKTIFFDIKALDENNYLITCTEGIYSFSNSTKKLSPVLCFKISSSISIAKADNNTLLVPFPGGICLIHYQKKNNVFRYNLEKKFIDKSPFNIAHIDSCG